MKKLYSYDNYEGDKGVIIADSLEEAIEIYKKIYPKRKITNNQEEYFNDGCYLTEEGILDGASKLFNTCPW